MAEVDADIKAQAPGVQERAVNRIRGVVAATLLACLVAPGTLQQNPRQPVPRFRTGVELVLLDVSVLDGNRIPVRGLTADDFTVLEDGRPQKVETFSAIDVPDVEEAAVSVPWIRNVAPDVQRNADFKDRRVVVIVMDDATPMPAAEVPRVKDLARRTIESLGPGDIAAVVFALSKSAGQDFTQDRARLLAAVDRFQGSIDRASAPAVPFDAFDDHATTMYQAAIGTLRSVAEYLVDLPDRRKALIWVSVGVPIDWDLAQAGLISLTDPGSASRSGMVQDVIKSTRELLASAQRANVNIYGLDPGGLRGPDVRYDALGGTAQSVLNPGKLNRDFLQGVSASTGGFAVVDINDPDPGIRQIYRENGSYYLLGYAPPNPRAQGRFRRIEVRVNRPGVTVRARSGYYEPLPQKRRKVIPAASPVDTALAGIIPKSDLAMRVTAAPFGVPGRREAAVAVVLGVHQTAPMRATRVVQSIDLRVAAYSPDGRQRASRREKVEATLNTPGFGGTIGYELLSRLDLAPGRYQLRLAAESSLHGIRLTPRAPEVGLIAPGEDTAGKSGSVYYELDVPDFLNTPLSVSGILLTVTPAVVSGPKDRLASLVPVVPTTLREFTRDDQVTGFLRVSQGGKNVLAPITLSVRIVDGNGANVFDTSETLRADRFAKARAADYFLDLPIARLKSGPHLLTIQAKAGEKIARRDVRFEVR
jgi:VWFA-related protein